MVNFYHSIRNSSKTLGEIHIKEFLSHISSKTYINQIIEARNHYTNSKKAYYDNIKVNELPCYTLNFTFDGFRKNELIKSATGFIYLDVDNNTDIDIENPLIYASWISLSGKGRGILVKSPTTTIDNFKFAYESIAKELDINADLHASKHTQLNVLSYDPNIYINYNSNEFNINRIEKKYHYNRTKKNKKRVSNELVSFSNSQEIRFDNYDDILAKIDFDGELYFYSKEPIPICKAYLPYYKLKEGNRNTLMFSFACQFRALNRFTNSKTLRHMCNVFNTKKCKPPLEEGEVFKLVKSVMGKNNLVPNENDVRKIFYNPDYDLTNKEKRQINIEIISTNKRVETMKLIEEIINTWDFANDGKITQKKIASKGIRCLNTIKKYYPHFKDKIRIKNESFRLHQNSNNN